MSAPSFNLQAVKCIRFERFGEPSKVLKIGKVDLGEWDGKKALVRWLASPVNPVDLYIIRDQYGQYKPKLPAIAGVEGIGESTKGMEVGDRVIRYKMPTNECPAGGGIWTEFAFVPQEALLKVDSSIELASAATLGINPATAYAMLKEIVPLGKGDCIVQNGANSSVGRFIIQLAKHFGFQTINLIRGTSADVADTLRSLGADWVFTQEEFANVIKGPHKLPLAKLALNCVGGDSCLLISRVLEPTGVLITYGEISGYESKCAGGVEEEWFSIGQFCSDKANCEKVKRMFAELQQLILDGKLRPPPVELRQIDEFQTAIENAISHGKKQILLLSPQERGMSG